MAGAVGGGSARGGVNRQGREIERGRWTGRAIVRCVNRERLDDRGGLPRGVERLILQHDAVEGVERGALGCPWILGEDEGRAEVKERRGAKSRSAWVELRERANGKLAEEAEIVVGVGEAEREVRAHVADE